MDWFEKKETGSRTIILAIGEVKTLLNWSNNREHISSLSLTSNCECGFKRGPISLLQMLNLLAYLKKNIRVKFDFCHSNRLIIEFLFEVTITDSL